eukprot:c20693_g1_i1 orf=3-494(-)
MLSTARNNGQYGSGFLSRVSFADVPREGVREARNRLDERLRQNITGMRRNLSEEPDFFNDDGDNLSSERETWEMSLRDWLTVRSFDEWWQELVSSPELASKPIGLSKAVVSSLLKEVFVPNMSTKGKEVEDDKTGLSEQEDCPICLEHFLPGQTLLYLPCKHRF